MIRKSNFLPIALLTLTLTACGGSDDPPADNSGTGNNGGNAGSGNTTFFNDQSGFSFADTLGGRMSSLFSTALGAIIPSGAPLGQSRRQILATQNDSQTCVGGGSIDSSTTTDDVTNDLTALSVVFNNCIEGGETANGSISISGTGLGDTSDSGTISVNFSNFNVTGAEPVAINGQVNMSVAITGDESTATVNGSGITMTADGETITFSNYSMTAITNDTTGATSVLASATIASSVDGTVTISINPALSTPSDLADYPVSGVITMTHSDGSSLTIDANTGDPETFSYSINENGTVTTGVGNWFDTDLDLS